MKIEYLDNNKHEVEVGDVIVTSDYNYLVVRVESNEARYGLLELTSSEIVIKLKSIDSLYEGANIIGDDEFIKHVVKNKEITLTLPI